MDFYSNNTTSRLENDYGDDAHNDIMNFDPRASQQAQTTSVNYQNSTAAQQEALAANTTYSGPTQGPYLTAEDITPIDWDNITGDELNALLNGDPVAGLNDSTAPEQTGQYQEQLITSDGNTEIDAAVASPSLFAPTDADDPSLADENRDQAITPSQEVVSEDGDSLFGESSPQDDDDTAPEHPVDAIGGPPPTQQLQHYTPDEQPQNHRPRLALPTMSNGYTGGSATSAAPFTPAGAGMNGNNAGFTHTVPPRAGWRTLAHPTAPAPYHAGETTATQTGAVDWGLGNFNPYHVPTSMLPAYPQAAGFQNSNLTQALPPQATSGLSSGQQLYGNGLQYVHSRNAYAPPGVVPADDDDDDDEDEFTAPPSMPEPQRRNNNIPRAIIPSRSPEPGAQSSNSTARPLTAQERNAKRKEIQKKLRQNSAPVTDATRGRPGPKTGKRGNLNSNFGNQGDGTPSSASPGGGQSQMNPPPARQSPQQVVNNPWEDDFDFAGLTAAPAFQFGAAPMSMANPQTPRPTAPTRASTLAEPDGDDVYTSSSSSKSGSARTKRKATTDPGAATKRARLLTSVVDNTERTVAEKLASLKRNMDTPMSSDFSARGTNAMQHITNLQDAEDIVHLRSRHIKYYKLDIDPSVDTIHLVQGQVLEDVQKTLLAALQHSPPSAPDTHPFKAAYNYNHQTVYADLMSKLVNDDNHLEAAAKIYILIEKVKKVHLRGVAMSELSTDKFDTQEKIDSNLLPKDARTRRADRPIDQTLTCIDRLFRIAEVIKVNKWIANDIMRGSWGEDWVVLVCCPDSCLELKATNWEANYKKKTKGKGENDAERAAEQTSAQATETAPETAPKKTAKKSLPQEGDEVILLDDE